MPAEKKMTKSLLLLLTSVAGFHAAAASAAVQAAEPDPAAPDPAAQPAEPAQDTAAAPVAAHAPLAEPRKSGGWEFIVTPYLWAAGSKTKFTTRQDETVTVKDSFFDILGDLKFAFMSGAEAKHDRLVLTSDIMFMSLGASGSGNVGPIPLEADVDLKLLIMTGLAGVRVVDEGPRFFDLMGGLRHISTKVDVELTGPFETRERSPKISHIGPVLAARGRAPLGERWGIYGYADVGGFGISSASSWQLRAEIQYDISQHWQLGGGWRHLHARDKKNGFELRQTIDGPIFTVSRRF
jgi:opacity protein-like surface antigen